ncbi:hypothetical protein D3C84_1242700 [compost metagenome]
MTEHADLRVAGDLPAAVGVRAVVAQGTDVGRVQFQRRAGGLFRLQGVAVVAGTDQDEAATIEQVLKT